MALITLRVLDGADRGRVGSDGHLGTGNEDRFAHGGAARLQAQAQDHGGVEVLDLGRRQIVRGEDRRLAQNACGAGLAGEPAHHPRRHIRDVSRAGPQIGVLEGGKTVRELCGFRLPGGLRADAIFEQPARDCAEQFRVFEEERLRIENAGLIRANVSFGPFVQRPGLFLRAVDGGRQALLFSLGIFDGPRGDLHCGGAQPNQRADGDARGRRDAAGLGHRFRRRHLAATGFDEAHQRGERLARFCALRADPQLAALARAQAEDGVDATGGDVVQRHLRLIAAGQANELRRGARVLLVSGPTALAAPGAAELTQVETAEEMLAAVLKFLPEATVVIKTAAVADFRPKAAAGQKIKRKGELTLELEPTADILAEVARRKTSQVVVGFAAETENVLGNARKKLASKSLDAIVVNDVSREGIGFDSDRNAVTIISPDEVVEVPETSKWEVAQRVLDQVVKLRKRSGVRSA